MYPTIRSTILILTLAQLLAGVACTTRQVYQSPTDPVESAPTAININTATLEELEALPHIGHKTAEAIVRFRTENGPFRRPEYLLQIRGVSEKRFSEIRPLIRTE